jgi:hypothetical protein
LVIGQYGLNSYIQNKENGFMLFSTVGTERMRIDSSGNVLVGKTASGLANSGFEVGQSGQINVTQTGATVGRFNRKTSDGSILEFAKDGTTVGSIGSVGGVATYLSSSQAGGIKFTYANSTDAVLVPCTTTGANKDASHDIGSSVGRFKDLYLSGGVYLGGTGSANKLDDYEEGTWTPVDASGQSLTFSGVVAEYTKVGKLVTASFNLTYPGSAGSAYATIGGLPFTTSSTANLNWGGFSTYSSVGYAIGYLAYTNSTSFSPYAAINYVVPPNNTAILGKTFRGVIVYRTT